MMDSRATRRVRRSAPSTVGNSGGPPRQPAVPVSPRVRVLENRRGFASARGAAARARIERFVFCAQGGGAAAERNGRRPAQRLALTTVRATLSDFVLSQSRNISLPPQDTACSCAETAQLIAKVVQPTAHEKLGR